MSAGKKCWDTVASQKYLHGISLIIRDIRLKFCMHILHDICSLMAWTRPLQIELERSYDEQDLTLLRPYNSRIEAHYGSGYQSLCSPCKWLSVVKISWIFVELFIDSDDEWSVRMSELIVKIHRFSILVRAKSLKLWQIIGYTQCYITTKFQVCNFYYRRERVTTVSCIY